MLIKGIGAAGQDVRGHAPAKATRRSSGALRATTSKTASVTPHNATTYYFHCFWAQQEVLHKLLPIRCTGYLMLGAGLRLHRIAGTSDAPAI